MATTYGVGEFDSTTGEVKNIQNTINSGTLQGGDTSVTLPKQPELTPVPLPVVQPQQENSAIMDYLNSSSAPQSMESQYNQNIANAGISGLQGNVNVASSAVSQEQANLSAIQARLNAISASGTQAQLQLESGASGKDVTSSFLGRQQQEVARQAGIQALPLQAEALASQAKIQSLQGNAQAAQTLLTQAQDHIDKLFSIQSQDAQNEYNYKQKLLDTIYSYATKKEQQKLDEQKTKNEQEFQLKRDAINNQYDTDKIKLQNSLKAQNDSTPQVISDTVNQIMSNPEANTPVLARAVLSELVGNKAISSGTRAKIAPAVEVLNAVEELAGLNQEGKFIGSGGIFGLAPLGQWFKGIFNAQDTEYVNNRQALEAINLKAQQWASGAALTEEQTKQVQKFTPNVYDSDKQMRTKINGLYNFMLNQAEAGLLTEGINVQFPPVNLFETYDLMKKASPEQRKELEKLLNQQ